MPLRETPPATDTLPRLMREIQGGDWVLRPHDETEDQERERIKQPGSVHQITEQTYFYFLELMPSRWMVQSYFAFGEGHNPLRIFWRRGDQHYCRQLNDEQTVRFRALTGVWDIRDTEIGSLGCATTSLIATSR